MKRVSKWIGALLIALCLAVVLFPPFFILFSSLLSEWELDFLIHEVGSYAAGSFLPIRIPPYEVDLHQFRAVLLDRPEILRTLLNTMGYAAITLAGMFLVAPLAAFVFAKLRFKGNSVLFFLYVFLLLLPFQVLCVPLYLTVSTLRLMDTPWAVSYTHLDVYKRQIVFCRFSSAKLIILNCPCSNRDFFRESGLRQVCLNSLLFKPVFESHKAPLSLIFREHE